MNDHGARVAYLSMPAMCSGLSSAALSSRLLGHMTHVDRDVAVTPQQLTCSDRG